MYVIFAALIFALITKVEPEESEDFCNANGIQCPKDKCCREESCLKDGQGFTCCPDPKSDPGCANCPKCSKNCSSFFY